MQRIEYQDSPRVLVELGKNSPAASLYIYDDYHFMLLSGMENSSTHHSREFFVIYDLGGLRYRGNCR